MQTNDTYTPAGNFEAPENASGDRLVSFHTQAKSAISHHARLIASLVRRGWFTLADAVRFQSKGSSLSQGEWEVIEGVAKRLINQN